MPITIDGNGIITGASTLATTVASPTLTTPNINSAQFATVTGTAPIYPCRAWVNFNGSGTVAIRQSGNVTSITDGGTGIFQVNLTTAMPDVNFATNATCTTEGVGSVQINAQTSSTTVLYCRQINASVITFFDPSIVAVSIFR